MNITRNERFDDVSNKAYRFLTNRQGGRQFLQPYIMIYKSEIQQIAGQAYSWGCCETGGALFGLFSHAFRPVIMFATGPGPDAIHKEYRFCDDIDFLIKAMAFMRNNYGLNYIGNHHSHHYMSVKGLSRRDIQSTHSIALKNGYRRLCQIVLTFEDREYAGFHYHNGTFYNEVPIENLTEPIFSTRRGNLGKFSSTLYYQDNFIKIHSFIYLDAKYGLPLKCPIKVIPGISPIRQALKQNCNMPELKKAYYFPMYRILFEPITHKSEEEWPENKLPTRLEKQYLRLSRNVRENTRVVFKEGFITFSLPTYDKKGMLFVAYSGEPFHKAIRVYIARNNAPGLLINHTTKALCFGPYTSLQTIYKRATNFVSAKKSTNDRTNRWNG